MPLPRPTRLALALAVAALATGAHAENLTPNLQLNGFATAGGAWVSDDFGGRINGNIFNDKGVTKDPNFQIDNVLGLQLTYALDDKYDLVAQLVSDGKNDYKTEAEWAYVAYRMNDNLRFRAGRITSPFFMYSESLNVGQAYPWVRLPIELYGGLYLKSMDGIDMQYRQALGDTWDLQAQVYAGESYGPFGKVRNGAGLNLNFSNDALTLHAGYGIGKIDFNIAADQGGATIEQVEYLLEQFGGTMNTKGNDVSFADLGATYDDGNWYLFAEYGQLRLKGWSTDWDAGILTAGHYFGKWLPFVSASDSNPMKTEECFSEFSTASNNASAMLTGYNSQVSTLTGAAGTLNAQAAVATAKAGAYASANGGHTANLTTDPIYMAYISAAATASTQADAAIAQATLYGQGAQQIAAALPIVSSAGSIICNGKEQTTYSLGFRYDATKNVSVKAQIDHVRDFNNSQGFTTGTTSQPDQLDMFSFNINAAF